MSLATTHAPATSVEFALGGKAVAHHGWSYADAFSRNAGLISPAEQERLRHCRVAIAGLGGVGGIDLVTLARLGIGRFTIADPDVFEVANFNRQYGAALSTIGRSKSDTMAQIVREINPEADVRVMKEPVRSNNVDSFLEGADVFVDAIEAFEINARRPIFRAAAERGIHGLGAGPVGFSTVWVVFDPRGMCFDRYFDLRDDMDPLDTFVAYIVGMAPAATHRSYMSLAHVDFAARTGPSSSLACQLSAGVVAVEVLKILLSRPELLCAPYYHQFDPYVGRYVRKRLRGGNRHPLQRLKRRVLRRVLLAHGFAPAPPQ